VRLRVLIFGGAGFVGLNIAAALLARGHGVTLFDRSGLPRAAQQVFAGYGDALTVIQGDVTETCRPIAVQPYIWPTFRGLLRHFSDLDDAWRWRFMRAILDLREGFPQATYDRCARFPNFHLREGSPVEAAEATGNEVELQTPRGSVCVNFVICGTGTHIDFA
jgi:FAD-dependent urate hydroxylase